MRFPEVIQVLSGDLVLFFDYLKDDSGDLLVVHPDERTLRHLQDIVVSKFLYQKVSFSFISQSVHFWLTGNNSGIYKISAVYIIL